MRTIRSLFRRQDRVTRGVALLDAEVPGWDARINLMKLDMHSEYFCVLGQLYGPHGGRPPYTVGRVDPGLSRHPYGPSPYTTGRVDLGLSQRGARRYGFDAYNRVEYWPLTRRWADVIRDRRSDDVRGERLFAEALSLHNNNL